MANERASESSSYEVICERLNAILSEHDPLAYAPEDNESLSLIAETESYLVEAPFYLKWLKSARNAGNTVVKAYKEGSKDYVSIMYPVSQPKESSLSLTERVK